MKMSSITPIVLAALTVGVSAAMAQEYRGDDAEEVRALDQVQVSLTDAIATAERETSGRALEAALESEGGRVFYQVDVFAENRIKEVYIDSRSGDVLDVSTDWD